MERQTRHRIFGAVVVIALVIILLPFFQGNKELSPETALITAPPFPDHPAPAPLAELSLADQSTTTTELKLPEQQIKPHDESFPANTEPAKTSKYRIIEAEELDPSPKQAASLDQDNAPNAKTQEMSMQTPPSQKLVGTPVDEGLLKLKGPVWVIQLGSFKDKTNALQMVNQLRANGYQAFLQEVSTALEVSTRVYVGPEQKHVNALALANRLQNEMNIKGIIISYKPLTL